MNQLTQKLGSGDMIVQELPYPQLSKGMVLVKNHYSIISSGTEGSTVKAARKNLIGKAKERPQQVKQVLETLKTQGVVKTYRAVMKKLDSYSSLGYSCSGEVIEVGEGVTEFKVGDKVACGGVGYASHAEIVPVPINLCVKLDNDSNLRNAAYNTIGAIAMQGVRQADMRIGETCVLVGLGLLGQLTALILRASGINVIGIDVSDSAVNLSEKNQVCDHSFNRSSPGIIETIYNLTYGIGADTVIISAGTDSLDPINFAGAVARKKGKVVVLGVIPTGFDRDPFWYRKELTLEMSCSYGPGRYDVNYEEKGIDYPSHYVRWTQKRNMQAFQQLLTSGKIDIDYMTSHEFNFLDAPKAFDLVLNRSEPFIGISLKYDVSKTHSREKIIVNDLSFKPESKVNISFIGAGSYALGNLLPNIPKSNNISKITILTNTGLTSKRVAEKFHFKFCASSENDIFDDSSNTIFITTRHNSHASYVLKSLESKKHVFVEKPLCLREEELDEIIDAQKIAKKVVMVGFNRRFSPLTQKIIKFFSNGPMSMIYRINAGNIPKDNWLQDIEFGGGRIIGEVCHFIDYLIFINGSLPTQVSAQVLDNPENLNDTVNILLKFKNGSTGVICYYANGSKSLSKEYLEVYGSGNTAILDDFKSLTLHSKGKPSKHKLRSQNKGQEEMINSFISGIMNNGNSPIDFKEIISVTRTCFKVLESIKNNGKLISL